MSSSPRSSTSSAMRFCSPPENVRSGRSATPVRSEPDGPGEALVPVHLGVVAAVVAPVGERGGVAPSGRPRPAARRRPAAGPWPAAAAGERHRAARGPSSARRSCVVGGADELAHHAEPAVDRQRARRRRQVAGDQPHQRRLADAVGADERGPVAVADREADVAQQLDAAREPPPEMTDLDRTHRCPSFCPSGSARSGRSRRTNSRRRPSRAPGFRGAQHVAQRHGPAPAAAADGVVVLGLGPAGGQLDPHGLAVDVDDDLLAPLRPALDGRGADAEAAGLGEQHGGQALDVGGVDERGDGVRRPALLHHDRRGPRVVGAGGDERGDGVGEHLAGDVVDVDLQLHGGAAGPGRAARPPSPCRRPPARRWAARAGRPCRRRSPTALDGHRRQRAEAVGQRHEHGHARRRRQLHRRLDADDRHAGAGPAGGRRRAAGWAGRRGPTAPCRGPWRSARRRSGRRPSECSAAATPTTSTMASSAPTSWSSTSVGGDAVHGALGLGEHGEHPVAPWRARRSGRSAASSSARDRADRAVRRGRGRGRCTTLAHVAAMPPRWTRSNVSA